MDNLWKPVDNSERRRIKQALERTRLKKCGLRGKSVKMTKEECGEVLKGITDERLKAIMNPKKKENFQPLTMETWSIKDIMK